MSAGTISAQQPRTMSERSARESSCPTRGVNVGETERWASLIAGGAMALYGLTSPKSASGWLLAGLGGCLAYRGLTGHCSGYAALGISTADHHGPATSVAAGHGVKLEQTIVINRPAADLYSFWRKLENIPRFMSHIESVEQLGAGRSHWKARMLGVPLEWDARIITDDQDSLIGWRSLEGSTVDTAGSVHFEQAPGGRGTQVRLVMKYDPPAGKSGAFLARLFGQAPEQCMAADLQRFKEIMEAKHV